MYRSLILAIALWVGLDACQAQPVQIHFLSAAESRIALTEGKGAQYFELLHIAELRAKTGLALQDVSLKAAREQARAFYAAATLDFTVEEQAALSEALGAVQPLLVERAPLYARTPWSFIKVTATLEGGLPHTRGDSIVLSDQVLASIVKARARAPLTTPSRIWNILVHEQTHVIQRHHPALFVPLYTAVYGFQKIALVPTPDWISSLRVINPDGPDVDWIFSVADGAGTQWLLPDILTSNPDHPRMPQDFQIVALGVRKQGNTWIYLDPVSPGNPQPLYGIDSYVQRFPTPDELFHPNEIAATMLAAWITGVGLSKPDSEMWSKLKDWATGALK
jgi:hypothetical protein